MPWLYSVALFVSAFLLFAIQPLMGRMLVPKLGGTPAAWNACVVFFQAVLLAGYLYAHAAPRWLARAHRWVHLALLLVGALFLPISLAESAFRDVRSDHPILLVLAQLSLVAAVPVFVISTTGPLLQRWFASTGHPMARDPYFLYVASNLGSMLALVAYPIAIEPWLPLPTQSWTWALGYAALALLILACTFTIRGTAFGEKWAEPAAPIPWARRLRWLFLAFVPSSFLLGCTTFISTDLAPIPLLWILPLTLYLLTFILAFSKRARVPHQFTSRLLPISLLVLTLVLLTGATELRGLPVGGLLVLHLIALFLTALVAHSELARDRPGPEHLTEFYLWLSLGGVLGGLFNSLLAPVLFARTGLTEYPVALVFACWIPATTAASTRRSVILDLLLPLCIGLLSVGFMYLAQALQFGTGAMRTAAAFGLPLVLAFLMVDRPRRYGLGLAALFLATAFDPEHHFIHRERNFFGVLNVAEAELEGSRFRVLFHGHTIHGQQRLDERDEEGRHEPLTYYHRKGPMGMVFEKWLAARPGPRRVGAIGLGTGSLAYYAQPGDEWTFYEIDPAVLRIAENPQYFSYLSECRASQTAVLLGDARLRLAEAPPGAYDLLVLDAFSSDAIPMHLLTEEALQLYRSKVANGGVIAAHISNRYLHLAPILGKLAERCGWAIRSWDDLNDNPQSGKMKSHWVILAERDDDFGRLVWPRGRDGLADPRWEVVRSDPRTPLWTDDFSNLLSAVDW